jgi:hypothetical protein
MSDEKIKRIESQLSAMLDKELDNTLRSTRQMVNSLRGILQQNPEDAETKRAYFMMVNFEVLYRVTIKNRNALKEVNKAIQELPDREEFERLKLAVQAAINEQDQKTADTEQKVVDTLQPLSELLNELKKVKDSKPFGDMYG